MISLRNCSVQFLQSLQNRCFDSFVNCGNLRSLPTNGRSWGRPPALNASVSGILYAEWALQRRIVGIRATYDGAKYHMIHRGKISEEYEAVSGVGGSILSTRLFLIIGDVLHVTLTAGCEAFQWMMSTYLLTLLSNHRT